MSSTFTPLNASSTAKPNNVKFSALRLPVIITPMPDSVAKEAAAKTAAAPWETKDAALSHLAALTELVAQIQSSDSPDAAARKLVVECSKFLNAAHVVVGFCKRANVACKVAAISDIDTFAPDNECVRLAQAVLQESIVRGELSVWPPAANQSPHALLAHRQYATFAVAPAIISSPLRDEQGRVQGAWFVALSQDTDQAKTRQFMSAAEVPLASSLRLLKQAQRGWLYSFVSNLSGSLQRKKVVAAVVACLAIAAALCIPTTCQISCSCTLEPVVRRHVAAPFAGPLDKAFVEPGDIVTKDQLLAQMDGRENRWELAGVQADHHRAAKERMGHMAAQESGKAEVMRHEVERLKLRQELLEHRDAHVQIRSPIDGIVVSGALKKSEGVPLTVGQNMFEIAPIDNMVVEMAIPEEDIRYVNTGMDVTLRLESDPFTMRRAKVERIQPRSELRDNENVYIAEVRLDNAGGEMRPGMKGEAWIAGNRYPLGWNLFRKPLAAALAWMGW